MVYNNLLMDVRRTDEFANWLKRLRDANARARINLRIDRIELTGNLGDVESVGEGVSELKIDYGPGYRLYFAYRRKEVILLLIGGDKSSQQKDIQKAKKLNEEYA
jgi:putative addiction module killer protein